MFTAVSSMLVLFLLDESLLLLLVSCKFLLDNSICWMNMFCSCSIRVHRWDDLCHDGHLSQSLLAAVQVFSFAFSLFGHRLLTWASRSTRGFTRERSPRATTSTTWRRRRRACPCWWVSQPGRSSSSTPSRRRPANSSMKKWVRANSDAGV